MMTSFYTYSERMTAWKYAPLFCILAATLFSLVIFPGYESFGGDQSVFLPPLYHKLDPSLFPNDLEGYKIMYTDMTFLSDFLALFVKQGVPILPLLFALTLIMRAAFFASLYVLALYITENRIYALVCPLFFITAFYVFGTGHLTIESAFSYRVLALPAGLMGLAGTLYRKWLSASMLLFFSFIIHPITALPFILFYYANLSREVWHRRDAWIPYVFFGSVPLFFSFMFFFFKSSGIQSETFGIIMDPAWKELASPRNAPALFAYWNAHSYISSLVWLALGGIPLLFLKDIIPDKQKRRDIALLILIPFVLVILAALGEYAGLHVIIKLHLHRSLTLFTIMSVILFGFFTVTHLIRFPALIAENTMLLAIVFWFLWKDDFVFLRETMIPFVSAASILFYGRKLFTQYLSRKHLVLVSLGILLFLDGGLTAKSFQHQDIASLILFNALLAASLCTAMLIRRYRSNPFLAVRPLGVAAYSALAATTILFLPRFTIMPDIFGNSPYMQACAWIEQHTNKEDVFVVEPFVQKVPEEFRLACMRPVFTTYKDGGIIPYVHNRKMSFDWKRRQDLAHRLPADWKALDDIQHSYRVNYIFSETVLPRCDCIELVFSNNRYFIYKIKT